MKGLSVTVTAYGAPALSFHTDELVEALRGDKEQTLESLTVSRLKRVSPVSELIDLKMSPDLDVLITGLPLESLHKPEEEEEEMKELQRFAQTHKIQCVCSLESNAT